LAEPLRTKIVVAAVILQGSGVLICQRTETQPFPLQWEFPGGKVEQGETLAEALRRELREELGIESSIGEELSVVHHKYAEGLSVELHFMRVESFTSEVQNRIFREVRWEERAALEADSFLEADRDVVRRLRDGLLP